MPAYIEAVVILGYTKVPRPIPDPNTYGKFLDNGEVYHVEEIRGTTPFLSGFKDATLAEREVRVGQWLTEDDAKALALAVTDTRIVVYRAEVTR